VLQDSQRVINPLIDRAYTDHSDDSAHEGPPVLDIQPTLL
jgi:hypothetical protein